ncbi:MAG TPA: TonB-dependent receptor, partial [Flavitalea sp.]|nr:TonB-dependent receptor [Flavitalea sp.]
EGEPILHATVHLLNTNITTSTSTLGSFEIDSVPAGLYQLQVTAIGYASRLIPVTVNASGHVLAIILSESYRQLDEVLVSGQKREEAFRDLPVSISVLNSRAVQQFQLWTIHDLSSVVPNLYTAHPGDGRNVTSIRGVTTTSYDPAVATYIDGVNQFGLDTYIPQLLDIDRIEILRGPQGTLYGRNAMGGVINILTKQPSNTTTGFAEVNAGSYSTIRISAGVRTPLVKNKLFAGIAAMYDQRKGYFKNLFNADDFDDQHSITANAFLKWIVNPKWTFIINGKRNAVRNDGTFPLVFAGNDPLTREVFQDAVTTMHDDGTNASLSILNGSRHFSFSSQTAFQSNYRYYDKPIDADFSPIDGVTIINNYGSKWNHVKAYTQEFRFSSAAGSATRLKWTTGAYFFLQKSPNKQATRFGRDAQLVGAPDSLFSIIGTNQAESRGAAVYGHVTYQLLPGLNLIAGIRYDRERKELSVLGEYQKDPDPDPQFDIRPDTSASNHFHAVSPKLGLSYTMDNNSIYAVYSKGFRAGGLTGFSSDPSQPPLYPFAPEFSQNIEAGYKGDFYTNRLTLRLAAFYIVVSDAQVPTLVLPDAITITRNAGKMKSKGAELELDGMPLNGWETGWHVGYTNARYTSLVVSQNGSEVNLKGKRQVFTPELTSLLYVQYTHIAGRSRNFKITGRGEWIYNGQQYFDLYNMIGQDPYHLFNLRAGIGWKKSELMFSLRNAADKLFIDYAYDFGALHIATPRIFIITLSTRF